MKAYNKPEFYVTEFVPNASVSACGIDTSKIYNSQVITCIMSGNQETAFSSADMGCNDELQDNAKTDFTKDYGVVDYDSKSYFVWYNSSVMTKPSGDENLFKKIMAAFFAPFKTEGYTVPTEYQGYHAGEATPEIISSQNHSN